MPKSKMDINFSHFYHFCYFFKIDSEKLKLPGFSSGYAGSNPKSKEKKIQLSNIEKKFTCSVTQTFDCISQ